MSESQGPATGVLEPHHFGDGFGPSGKDAYTPPSSGNGSELTDLSDSTHLTLLKSSSSLPTFSGFSESSDSLGSRLSDAFSEMRYIELQSWDLNSGYSTEGLTARLIDTRSLDSSEGGIQYRPWEKPVTTSPSSQTTPSNSSTPTLISGSQQAELVTTSGANGTTPPSARTEKSSPLTLTPLTNAFPTFSDTFNGPKLPSFQSQFNAFQEMGANTAPTTSSNTHINGGSSGIVTSTNHHMVTTNGHANGNHTGNSSGHILTSAPTLPSFHTLQTTRGYTPHGSPHGHMVASPATHLVTSTTQLQGQQHQFIDDPRHIQLFPGQVQLAPAQFGQLIATTSAPQTMTIANGNQGHHGHGGPPPHHFVMTNGSNGFGAGGLQLQELVPVPPMQILHQAAVLPNSNGMSNGKQTTDGSIPGLNFNIIDPHQNGNGHHHPHHHITAVANGNTNGNGHGTHHLNIMPKTYFQNGNNDPIEAHLIAVKLPPNGAFDGSLLQQNGTNSLQHHHKLSLSQNSPQIGSTNSMNGGTNGTNGLTPTNGKINGRSPQNHTSKRKRNGMLDSPHMGGDSTGMSHILHQHHNNNNNNNHVNHNNNNNGHGDMVNDPQVSSVSSTDNEFKRPSMGHLHGGHNGSGLGGLSNSHSNGLMGDDSGLEKPVKKKRKRCGECTGCQRKDNCGDCAPCRNDKSHQICKVRRCEKLTDKKVRFFKVQFVPFVCFLRLAKGFFG